MKPARNQLGKERGGNSSAGVSRSPRLKGGGSALRRTRLLKLNSVLVPTDFSAESRKAIEYAVAFARQFGAKLTLLYVVEPVATPDFAKSFPLVMEKDELSADCKRHLERFVRESGIEEELIEKTLVRNGRAYHEITSAAKTLKSDIIIISTHGYTGLKHAIMGSTTERVVRHAPCPVLVVRPGEHEFIESDSKLTMENAL